MSSNPYEPPASLTISLPIASEASIKNGIWFVFPLQGATVRTWSGLTGIERVYVDEKIVSEHRSMGKLSEHRFTASGEDFLLSFTTISLLRGPLECRLFRGGVLCGAQRASFESPGIFSQIDASKLVFFLVMGGIVGIFVAILKLPIWPVAITTGAVVFLIRVAMRKPSGKRGIRISAITEDVPGTSPKPDQ